MQPATTFDIAFEEDVTIDGKLQDVSGKLRGQVLSMWNRLHQALPAVDSTPLSDPQAPSGYYAGAYDRVSASVPVASFRGLV